MIKSKGSGMPYNHLTSELLTAPLKIVIIFTHDTLKISRT